MSVLTDDHEYPILAEWVLELLCLFIEDLSANVQHTRVSISSICCPWEEQLPMFKHFSIPIWAHYTKGVFVIDPMLCRYILSWETVTSVTEALQWGQTPADSTWDPDKGHQHLGGEEMQLEPIPRWSDVNFLWGYSDNECQSDE